MNNLIHSLFIISIQLIQQQLFFNNINMSFIYIFLVYFFFFLPLSFDCDNDLCMCLKLDNQGYNDTSNIKSIGTNKIFHLK